MFFIFGSPRSGTTLVAQKLSVHSEVEVPYETNFIVPVALVFDRVREPEAGRELILKLILGSWAFQSSLGVYLTGADIKEIVYSSDYTLSSLLIRLYSKVARAAGKKHAGDKNPGDLQYIRLINKHLKEEASIKFLHVVRDVRDVMVSLKEADWAQDLDLYFPRMWSALNLYLHMQYRAVPSRYKLVRYEDLVSEPERAFSDICTFLDVAFEPNMLEAGARQERVPYKKSHPRLFKPITTERCGIYKEALDKAAIEEYERQASEALAVFGYIQSSRSFS